MTILYLVRHGETEWSKSGQHTSHTDLDLTERGVEQARALREKLDPAEFGLVLTSPRLRARRTPPPWLASGTPRSPTTSPSGTTATTRG